MIDRVRADFGFMHAEIADEHHQIIDAFEAKDLARVRELLHAHNDHAVHTMDKAVAAKAEA